MHRIIIAGSKAFNDYDLFKKTIEGFVKDFDKEDVEIISDSVDGADALSELWAKDNDYKFKKYIANFEDYGTAAEHRCHVDMVKYAAEEDGALIAFWNGNSPGTKHIINTAMQHGIDLEIVRF